MAKASYYTVPKTFSTLYFESRKERGFIAKEPQKALFRDGTPVARALWKDTETGEMWVKLDGQAFKFTPYPDRLQTAPGFIRGHV